MQDMDVLVPTRRPLPERFPSKPDSVRPDEPTPSPAPSLLELPCAALALCAVIAVPLVALGLLMGVSPLYPWTRPFWLDEFHTLQLAQVASPIDQWHKLGQGGDYNP